MQKQQLAADLRDRLRSKGLVPDEILKTVDDDGIIDSYITCSCCGEKALNAEHLVIAIHGAADAADFLDHALKTVHP